MQTENGTIRIGVVGAGANTRTRHLPRLQAMDGVEVVSVANRTRESSQRVADEFGIAAVYDSWEELVAAPDSDAIVVGTWPDLHRKVTVEALDAGKHVMCEARMALSAREANMMLQVAQQHPDLVAQVVPSPFTLPVDATINRLIAEGFLGRILAIEVRATSGRFLDSESPMTWRQDADLSGVNVMSLGIWYEALMRWVGEATHVFAQGRIFTPSRLDVATGAQKEVRVPEHLVVLAPMACGAHASFFISSVAGGVNDSQVTLYGSEGTLRFCNGSLFGMRRTEESMAEISIPQNEAVGWRVEEEFVSAIRGRGTIERTTFEDGVRYMEFTDAVARSVASGTMIAVRHPI